MKSKVLIVAAYLIIASGTGKLFAQQEFNTCGYAEQLRKLIQKNPTIVTQMDAFQKYQAEYIAKQKVSKMPASQQYIIPVVFHVLHNYGPENITDAQIIQAVSIINRDYNKKNADTISVRSPFNNIIANCDFEFRLARIDPKGNCTNGIEHIQTAQTYMGDDAAKFSQWPRDKYMNIWVSNTLPTAGQAAYAFQPPSVSGISSPLDGIMCLYTYVGDNGTSNPSNSRTLTHELGHSLGLSHTWGNTNNPEVACGDDGIADTPPTQGDNPGCKNPLNFTCSKKTMSKTYTFDSVNVSSGTTDPTPIIPGAVDSTILTFGSFTANNVSVNPTSSKLFEYSGWGTGATDGDTTYANLTGSIDVTKYYEVTLTAKYARAIDLSALNFYFHRSATGPRTFSVRSSRDNYATNLVPTVTGTLISTRSVNTFFSRFDTSLTITGCTVNLPAGYNTNLPLTFRFYGWNAEDIAGSFGIDNVNFVIDGGTNENVENYMNYSYCCKMFTLDQKAAMVAALNSAVSSRNNLWTPANLAATGTDGGTYPECAPKADFHSTADFTCSGSSVVFNDDSWGATVTNRTWSFPNGTPSTATTSTVTVTYTTPGWQSATLTVSNASGTDTKTVTKSVYVSPLGASQYTGSYSEDFESKTKIDTSWFINNLPVDINNTSAWQLTNSASYSGTNCMKLNGFFVQSPSYPLSSNAGDIDEMVTPSVDLTGVSPLYFSFRYSYASQGFKVADITESLTIYSSTNCGKSWIAFKTITGAELANAGTYGTQYTPSTGLWKSMNVTLSPSLAKSGVRFKFVYKAGPYSNNLYIDDVNIGPNTISVVGVNEVQATLNSLNVFPNPASDVATIAYHLGSKQNVDLAVYDMLGNKVMVIANQLQNEGDYTYKVSKLDFAKGMYFIRLNVNDKETTVKKFVLLD